MSLFLNKKVVVIGDRDGIPGPAIDECLKTAGAEIVFSSTSRTISIMPTCSSYTPAST